MIVKSHPYECLLSYYNRLGVIPPKELIKIKPLDKLLKRFPGLRWEGFGGYVGLQRDAIQKFLQGHELTYVVRYIRPKLQEVTIEIPEVHGYELTYPAELFCVQGGSCEIQPLPE